MNLKHIRKSGPTFHQTLAQIKTRNWYRQGGAILPFYVFGPFMALSAVIGPEANIITQKSRINIAFFDRDIETVVARRFLRRQLHDGQTIARWIDEWRGLVKKHLAFCRGALRKPVATWTDRELRSFLIRNQTLARKHWRKGVLIECTDPYGDELLRDSLARAGVNVTPAELDLLLRPHTLTFTQREFIDRAALLRLIPGTERFKRAAARHAQQFHWIHNTWADVRNMTPAMVERQLARERKRAVRLVREAAELRRAIKANRVRSRAFIRAKRIPARAVRALVFFRMLAEWRDERKQYAACLPNAYLYPLVVRLSRQNRIPVALAGMLTYAEPTGWEIPPKKIAELRLRYRGSVAVTDARWHSRWFYGREAKQLYANLMERIGREGVHGSTANPGRALGIVRRVEAKADFSRVRRGDIIVAHATRPEILPALKKAGAIVTDEGGVTSHAAIVSRELGIPCIVGTQTATHVLKDGDRVEVDATMGVVRKL